MTTIVHTTDLTDDDGDAFAHSVALARASGARLVLLHANGAGDAAPPMPDAAGVLAAWGGDPAEVSFATRVHECCDDPVETVLAALVELAPELVVATTHRRSAVARFFAGSAAEAIAHNVRAPTLLLPSHPRGFVTADGRLDLHRILVPLGDAVAAAVAVRTAAWFAAWAKVDTVELVLLHVGDPVDVDVEALGIDPGWTVHRHDVQGRAIDDAIAEHADDACLVVMATRGHDSIGDVLRGSHTDRALHQLRRPILSVAV